MKTLMQAALLTALVLSGALAAKEIRLERLETSGRTYRKVRVKKVTPQGLFILHEGGLAQVLFEDLSPEMREAFGYDPGRQKAYREKLQAETEKRKKQAAQIRLSLPKSETAAPEKPVVDRILPRFGQEPELREEVNLRPKFHELELTAKDQGRRPSCSVFAVVSALEFQNAQVTGKAEKLSEEYLLWATRKILGLTGSHSAAAGVSSNEAEGEETPDDAGYNILEVLQALRAYGVPLQEQMRNTYGIKLDDMQEPSPGLIQEARTRRNISIHPVTGRDNAARIDNIIHVLNEGLPVVGGLGWPHWRTLRQRHVLSKQKPLEGKGHAVTFVGYTCPTGRKEDLRFTFKNSYGIRWGEGGYGFAEYEYVEKNLYGAAFLDIRKPE